MTILLGITWAKNSTAAIYKNGEIIDVVLKRDFQELKMMKDIQLMLLIIY